MTAHLKAVLHIVENCYSFSFFKVLSSLSIYLSFHSTGNVQYWHIPGGLEFGDAYAWLLEDEWCN